MFHVIRLRSGSVAIMERHGAEESHHRIRRESDERRFGEAGISTYAAAKHGVIGLSKAAAIEYASKGIRINVLAPGLVETAMTKPWFDDPAMRSYFMANSPIGRFAQSEEIAQVVLFLCSDFASFAVGQTFAIDGGYTAR
jgi:Dehydrogenases with different specificities (related to short-chain alcohol dehydrogenases)